MAKDRKERGVNEDDFSFFEIDEFNLDKEWVKQPALYFTWARKLADARLEVDEAKAALDVIKAEASRAIRDDPGEYGFDKVTEAIVAVAINEHHDVIKGAKTLHDARHRQELYQAAVNALDHRKRALEKLVDLHGQNYFSQPRTTNPDAAERLESASKESIRKKGHQRRSRIEDDE